MSVRRGSKTLDSRGQPSVVERASQGQPPGGVAVVVYLYISRSFFFVCIRYKSFSNMS